MKKLFLSLLCSALFAMILPACSDNDDATGAALDSLSLTGITLSPAFEKSVTNYTAAIAYAVGSTTLTPAIPAGVAITVTLNGNPVTGTAGSYTIELSVGANTLLVTAAKDGTSVVYTIVITRAAPGLDATLSAITFDATTTGFSFDPATTNYNFSIGSLTVTVTPTATDPNATILISVKNVTNTIASGEASQTITLSDAIGGGTMALKPGAPPSIYVVVYLHVTAENGIDKRTYRMYIQQL